MKGRTFKLVFGLAGCWFLIAAVAMFFRKGIAIGGLVFVAAGIWFLYLALGRRR